MALLSVECVSLLINSPLTFKKKKSAEVTGKFLDSPMLRVSLASAAGAQVLSLVGELKIPCTVVWLKQKTKKQDILEQNIAVLTLTGFESRMI